MADLILIGIGSNLTSAVFGPPQNICNAALDALAREGCEIRRRSRWYESAPVPVSDQPWFVNGVVEIATSLKPPELLTLLHAIELAFGRVRRERNEARVIDLDLLAYDDLVSEGQPVLPHPRLHERAFVLLPLAEIAPGWRHPASGKTVAELIQALPKDQIARPL